MDIKEVFLALREIRKKADKISRKQLRGGYYGELWPVSGPDVELAVRFERSGRVRNTGHDADDLIEIKKLLGCDTLKVNPHGALVAEWNKADAEV